MNVAYVNANVAHLWYASGLLIAFLRVASASSNLCYLGELFNWEERKIFQVTVGGVINGSDLVSTYVSKHEMELFDKCITPEDMLELVHKSNKQVGVWQFGDPINFKFLVRLDDDAYVYSTIKDYCKKADYQKEFILQCAKYVFTIPDHNDWIIIEARLLESPLPEKTYLIAIGRGYTVAEIINVLNTQWHGEFLFSGFARIVFVYEDIINGTQSYRTFTTDDGNHPLPYDAVIFRTIGKRKVQLYIYGLIAYKIDNELKWIKTPR